MPLSPPGMSKELALLIVCTSTQPAETKAERIGGLLSDDLDWERLLALARWQKLVPLLASELTRNWRDRMPQWVRKQMQGEVGAIAMHNWVRTRELLRLMESFDSAGIPAVSFKGPVLAQSAYGDWSLRHFWDLDILVDKNDVARAKALLLADGFHLKYDLEWQSCLLKEEGETEVDLHWELMPRQFPALLDMNAFRGGITQIELGGTAVRSLSREHMLLLLCVNLVKEVYAGWANGWRHMEILKICDIAHLTAHEGNMDWKLVFDEARRLACKNMLCFGLCLADQIVGLQFPDEVTQRIRLSSRLRSHVDEASVRILSDKKRLDSVAPGRERFLFEVSDESAAGRSYWAFSLRRFAYLLFSPTIRDENIVRLPQALHFLYYFMRPVRLIGKYRSDVFGQLRSFVSEFDRTR